MPAAAGRGGRHPRPQHWPRRQPWAPGPSHPPPRPPAQHHWQGRLSRAMAQPWHGACASRLAFVACACAPTPPRGQAFSSRRRSGIIVACALRLEEHRGTKPAFLIPPAPDRRRGLRGVRGDLKPPPGFPSPWPCWPHHGTDQTNPQAPQPTHPLQRLLDPQTPQPTHPLLAGFLGLSKKGWGKKQTQQSARVCRSYSASTAIKCQLFAHPSSCL